MKRIILSVVLCLLASMGLWAQDEVSFQFRDGVDNPSLKATMERNISRLLSAINAADSRNGDINYSGIEIDNLASEGIGMIWNDAHFRITDDFIVEPCMTIKTGNSKSSGRKLIGYQVRNIPMEMHPVADGYMGDLYQEACIDLDAKGNITDFNITMGVNQYRDFLRGSEKLDDLDRRMQILHWVEQFRNAYCQKDMNFMENVFSEDALIVTGKIVKRVPSEVEVIYESLKKREYLNRLAGVFKRNSYINVKFDDISVMRHAAKPNYYGVRLKQGWFTKDYSDEGKLFIIWDFRNELEPKILVRTWQPLEDEQVFELANFKLN